MAQKMYAFSKLISKRFNMIAPQKQILKNILSKNFSGDATKAKNVFTSDNSRLKRFPLLFNPSEREVLNPVEGKLDLNEYLIHNPETTFLIRVTGDSMMRAGINSGDILVVDRAMQPVNGKIVVAAINDQLLVKRLRITSEGMELIAENENYPTIYVGENDKFNIWGVVSSVVKVI